MPVRRDGDVVVAARTCRYCEEADNQSEERPRSVGSDLTLGAGWHLDTLPSFPNPGQLCDSLLVAEQGDGVENTPDDDGGELEPEQVGVVLRASGGGMPPIGAFGLGGVGSRRCSFCSRREAFVDKLVQSRGAYICDRCVGLAANAIDGESADRVVRNSSAVAAEDRSRRR